MFVHLLHDYRNQSAGQTIDLALADAEDLIAEGIAEPVDSDPLTPLLTRALDSSLERAFKRFQLEGRRTPFAGLGDSSHDDPRAGFKNLGEFALAVKDACQPGQRPDDRLLVIAKAAAGMGEAFGSDGGFLVPAEFATRLLERVYAPENLLGMTDSYTIAGNSITFPRNAETSRANGSRWGGVRAYWREEGDQATATKPTFGRIQLNLHKLFVLIHASDELLADVQGMALEQYLLRIASEEISFVVGDAILNGTGAGQPQGILGSSCLVTVNKESGQTAATVVAQNVVMLLQFKPVLHMITLWLYSRGFSRVFR